MTWKATLCLNLLLPPVVLSLWVMGSTSSVLAATTKTLYSFCTGGTCTGVEPFDVIADSSGTLYGVTRQGGDLNAGTVFALVPNAKKTKWKYQRIWSFCATGNCPDGENPQGGLIVDTMGNLYGTTTFSGTHGQGTLFRLSHKRKTWKLDVIYNFCALNQCADASPTLRLTYAGAASGAPYDGTSPIFAANYNSVLGGNGTAFMLTPKRKKEWQETTLYAFCQKKNCTDGANPQAILADGSGNLFGTTASGGSENAGAVFELSPVPGGGWTETVLHSFCASCATDGRFPQGQIAIGSDGSVFGATGGSGSSGNGVVFKLVPNGKNSAETVLYNFCPDADCKVSGSNVLSGIVLDGRGNLYGAAENSGPQQGGTLFELNPGFSVLHAFCGCSGDGAMPLSATADGSGNVFGVTLFGGDADQGMVFEFKP
jgi:uncharacterized repeat protein (TIGR03803 family)